MVGQSWSSRQSILVGTAHFQCTGFGHCGSGKAPVESGSTWSVTAPRSPWPKRPPGSRAGNVLAQLAHQCPVFWSGLKRGETVAWLGLVLIRGCQRTALAHTSTGSSRSIPTCFIRLPRRRRTSACTGARAVESWRLRSVPSRGPGDAGRSAAGDAGSVAVGTGWQRSPVLRLSARRS